MSEENQESGMSAIKKTIIGAITTAVTAGGAWFATHLGGGEDEKPETPTAVAAPAPVINITTNNEQKQQANTGGGNTIIIKEKAAPAAAQPAPATKPKVDEEDPW
jgi:hypothetical protein